METRVGKTMASLLFAALLCAILSFSLAQPAFAAKRDELDHEYQTAIVNLQGIIDEQTRNEDEIESVEVQIQQTQSEIESTRDQLHKTAVSLYKGTRDGSVLVDYVLGSSSFQEAVMRYDTYERIERYYRDQGNVLAAKKIGLEQRLSKLQERKAEIERQRAEAERAAEEAEKALRDSMHTDGAKYHQLQMNGSNCGATAFIVSVNTLLHENRYVDNEEVWAGPGFNGDSTADIAYRGGVWLVANNLSDVIGIENVPGDIHTAEKMRELLEDGNVVVTSSGPGSPWRYADGESVEEGGHPFGHWISFYCYQDGVFYANDSSGDTARGAGCPYTEEQMQQWLDGREAHYSVILYKK